MNRTQRISALALLAVLLVFPLPTSAQDQNEGADLVWRVYPVQYLDLREAGLLIERGVPEMLDNREYSMRPEHLSQGDSGKNTAIGFLRFRTAPEFHQRIETVLAEVDRPPLTRVFQIFILGASDREALPPDLPPGATSALLEMQSLLPFKGYSLIESALIRSSGTSRISVGPNYNLEFSFVVDTAQDKPLHVVRFMLASPRGDGWARHIDTAFSTGIGETVVVGTSRPMEGDAALVVLLTALE